MLVCIAGTDGCGKSTLVKSLQQELSKTNLCKQMRLYDNRICPKLQKKAAFFLKKKGIEFTKYNLLIAYLMYELEEKSLPNLLSAVNDNDIVILDRYIETIDFIVNNYDIDKRLINNIMYKFMKPDIYIYLRINPLICYNRIVSLRKPSIGEELNEIKDAANYYDKHIKTYGFTIVNGEDSKEKVLKNSLAVIKERCI
ncbi:hypothetical protein AN1V17_39610 [Vallitalea sediminicola]